MIPRKKILFYYLSAFSNTGGIEKFNRCFIKALTELDAEEKIESSVVSVYDQTFDKRYTTGKNFIGFAKKRGSSVRHIIKQAFKQDVIILGHINLAIAGVIVKLIRPKCKVIIIAHGIEVWNKMYFIKKYALRSADMVLSVSNYTKNQLVLRNNINPSRVSLFPNTIDPYFKLPSKFDKPDYLLQRYGIKKEQPIILTLSRLVSSEQYKGYDKVIASLPKLLEVYPEAVYILAGKYDEIEKERIYKLLDEYHVRDKVILTGFVKDEEITDHYCLADVFIMPSRKEGFGIVFLEALACGTQVIGGNQDGTVDALQNGSLGTLINPTKTLEISEGIINCLQRDKEIPEVLQFNVLNQYRFDVYKKRLERYLTKTEQI